MNESFPVKRDEVAYASHQGRESSFKPRRHRYAVFIATAILVGLLGAYSSWRLWRGGETVLPQAAPDVTSHAEIQEPAELPTAAAPVGDETNLDSPLPATAGPLLGETGQVIDRLVDAFPNNLDCLEMRARFQKWTGKSDEAVKTWEECLELNPRYAHAYLGMAEAAAKKGEHEKAADLAGMSMQIAPGLFQARAVLAEALVNLGRPEEAIKVLEEYLPADPRSHGYFLLGRAYTLLKQFEKAKENYEASIRKYPEYAEAYYGLSRVCARLGQTETAREFMAKNRELMATRYPGRQGMDMTPESFDTLCTNAAIIYTDTGRIYHAHERLLEAKRLWLRAAALSPRNIECRQALAWLARSHGETVETIRWLEEVANLDPQNPNCWLEIGNLHISLTQLDPADQAFQKARAVAPQDARGHAAMAALYLRSGRNAYESLTLARKAVELESNAANFALLATACQRNGDLAGALSAIEEALAREPGNPEYPQMRDAIEHQLSGGDAPTN